MPTTFTATIHTGTTSNPTEDTAGIVSRRFDTASDAWCYLADWRVSIEDMAEKRGLTIERDVEPLMDSAHHDRPGSVWMPHPAVASHPLAHPGHTFSVIAR